MLVCVRTYLSHWRTAVAFVNLMNLVSPLDRYVELRNQYNR